MQSVVLLLMILVTVAFGSVKETPQEIVTKYNNYRTICTGLGYRNLSCNAEKKVKQTIAFQTTLSSSLQNIKSYQAVIFDTVKLNEGNGYDKTTGIFTAPEDGVYTFSWAIASAGGKYFISEIAHNGKPIAYSYSDGSGRTGYVTSSNTANIKMKKGDKAGIRAHNGYGKFALGGYYCTFSGFKI
ncbi:cerebellin-3-like [Saccostrea cucullata]|uniref:cerebellin-3-like n=1 Tax=Saccostrea cuccullata TaxID=36930 RepID=UPI002ED484D5